MMISLLASLSLAVLASAVPRADSPYGYDSHLIRPCEYPHLERLLDLMQDVDVGWFRTGIRWDFLQKTPGKGDWDFSVYDDVIDRAGARGIRFLPIFHVQGDAGIQLREPERWCDYVRRCVTRYRGRVSHWEVWNEVNLGAPSAENYMEPEAYARLLKLTYETVKACDPSATVTSSGFGGIALAYIEKLYQAGGGRFFDVMNVHDYPGLDAGSLVQGLERLRALMAKYGDADKPIWMTETGLRVGGGERLAAPGFVAAALRAVDPKRTRWNVLLVEDLPRRAESARRLLAQELVGSTIATSDFVSVERRLAEARPDVVFLPLDCTYPADAMDALVDYVATGGTVVDLGGFSMYQPCNWKRTGQMVLTDGGGAADRTRLRFEVKSVYGDPRYHENVKSGTTEALEPPGMARTVRLPARYVNQRYFLPKGLKGNDTFVPLVAGKTRTGEDAYSAALIRYDSDWKGALVLSGWSERGVAPLDREDQAGAVARNLAACFGAGCEKVFWYSLCDCFGLVDPNDLEHGEAMPGQRAFKAFVQRRPTGSINLPGDWQNLRRTVFWPQWRRPDGRIAGALWSRRPRTVGVSFDARPMFYDDKGNPVPSPLGDSLAGEVALSERPIFFEGARVSVAPEVRFEALTDSARAAAMLTRRIKPTAKGLEGRFEPTYPSVARGPKATARPVPPFLRASVMYQLFTRMFTPEGTFAAAAAKLPELKDLGVDIIYLTPHQLADDDPDTRFWSARQKRSGFGNAKNPYRQKDFYAVDPEYGTRADLRAFVDEAHRLGLRVLFDLVYFHCGPAAVFLKDHPEYVVRNPDGTPRLGDWAFPEMDVSKREVRDYLHANMESLLRDYSVDGFRCDVADMLPVDFWEEGYARCRAIRPDVILMCEGLKGDDQIAAFDLSYGFYTQWTMVEFLKGTASADLLEKAWREQKRDFPKDFHWMRCFENHDFANVAPGEKRKETLYGHDLNDAMLATCFLLDGVPMLYNGQEIADAAPHSIFSNRDHGGWCIDWSRAASPTAVKRRAFVKRLAALRHAYPALFDAPVVWNKTADAQSSYSFSRPLPGGTTVTLTVDLKGKTHQIRVTPPRVGDSNPRVVVRWRH